MINLDLDLDFFFFCLLFILLLRTLCILLSVEYLELPISRNYNEDLGAKREVDDVQTLIFEVQIWGVGGGNER